MEGLSEMDWGMEDIGIGGKKNLISLNQAVPVVEGESDRDAFSEQNLTTERGEAVPARAERLPLQLGWIQRCRG